MLWLTRRVASDEAKLRELRRSVENTKHEIYEKYRELLASEVGHLAMSWSVFEMLLDIVIGMIHRHGGKDVIRGSLPTSLKEKVTYLRKAPRVLSAVTHLEAETNAFAEKVQILKETRHDCLHGILLIDPEDFSIFSMRLRYNGAQVQTIGTQRTFKEVGLAVDATLALCQAGAAIFGRFAEAFDDKEAIETHRQFENNVASFAVKQRG